MNNQAIQEMLENYDLSEISQIDYKEDAFVVRFFYDFDDDVIEAAKAYANDESKDEEYGDTWMDEYFLPYLNDYAVDNVGEYIEEIMEELDLEAQFVSYDMDEEEYNYNEFIAVFFPKNKNFDIEQILGNLEL